MHDDAACRESLSSSCHISPAKSRLIGVLTVGQCGGYGFIAACCTFLLTHTIPEVNRLSEIPHEELVSLKLRLSSDTLDKLVIV